MTRRRNLLSIAVSILLFAGGIGCAHGDGSRWDGPFFFIQMADPQFGMFAGNADLEKETELFAEAIEHANRLEPAFVVICGDLIHKPGDQAQVAELLRLGDKLDDDIPLYLVSGNHDVENVPTADSLAWYRETLGKDWYAFLHGGCRFLVLNSTIIHRPDHVADEMQRQRAWLENQLAGVKQDDPVHTVVFQHHSFFMSDANEKDAYANIPKSRRLEYLETFRDAGVSAVFTGHHHGNNYATYHGIELITTSAVGKPLRGDPSGFRIVKVYRDRIEHEYVGLDAVPACVELAE